MKLFTILVFAMASFFNARILDARYKIDVIVEGGPKESFYVPEPGDPGPEEPEVPGNGEFLIPSLLPGCGKPCWEGCEPGQRCRMGKDVCPMTCEDPSTTFNETCCSDHGVPEECMGNCRKEPALRPRHHAPMNKCDKFKTVIHKCVINELTTIADVIKATPQLSALFDTVGKFPDLADALTKPDTFTVFAPDNTAFKEIEETVGKLSKEEIEGILKNHIVKGKKIMAADLQEGTLNTLAGDLKVVEDNGKFKFGVVMAEVVAADKVADNGVVHVINKVLTGVGLKQEGESCGSFWERGNPRRQFCGNCAEGLKCNQYWMDACGQCVKKKKDRPSRPPIRPPMCRKDGEHGCRPGNSGNQACCPGSVCLKILLWAKCVKKTKPDAEPGNCKLKDDYIYSEYYDESECDHDTKISCERGQNGGICEWQGVRGVKHIAHVEVQPVQIRNKKGAAASGRSLFGKKKCKKSKCKKAKNLDWCKQNCVCCKKRNGKPKNLESKKDAKKCKKWKKKSKAGKCKYGAVEIEDDDEEPEPTSDENVTNNTQENNAEDPNQEENQDYDNTEEDEE